MIAADSSSIIAFFTGEQAADIDAIYRAIEASTLHLPPAVVSELMSDAVIGVEAEVFLNGISLLNVLSGYWSRAGKTRSLLIRQGFKAKLGDALIAQSCIDYDVPLITRDKDFRHYAKHCGLKLYHA